MRYDHCECGPLWTKHSVSLWWVYTVKPQPILFFRNHFLNSYCIPHTGLNAVQSSSKLFQLCRENLCLNLRNQWEIILKCDHHSVHRAWTVHESCTETRCPVAVMAACVFRSWGTILRERVTSLRNSYFLESKSSIVIAISLYFMGGNKFLL